jgi:nitrile hydratase accessory protein
LSKLENTLSELPRDASGPVFEEPWQAQAFALVLELHARGVFSWDVWTQTLAAELRAGDGQYYAAWLRALERLLGELGIADAGALAARKHAWAEAYRRTPHGSPVIPHSSSGRVTESAAHGCGADAGVPPAAAAQSATPNG